MDSLNLGDKQALKLRRSAGQPLELLVAFPLRRNGIDTFVLRFVRIERLRKDRVKQSMTVEAMRRGPSRDRIDPWDAGPQDLSRPVDAVAVSRPLFARDRDRSEPIKKR